MKVRTDTTSNHIYMYYRGRIKQRREGVKAPLCCAVSSSELFWSPVVRLSVCLSVCLSSFHIFIFLRTTGPISIKEIQVCSNEEPRPFPWKIIVKKRKCIVKIEQCSSPEPQGQFQPNLARIILGWKGFKFVQIKGYNLFQGDIILI